MRNLNSKDIETGVYEALKSEVQSSRDTFKAVINGLLEPAELEDAPWIGALTWLNMARSSAALVANLAPQAAIPVWMLDQAAIVVDATYGDSIEQRATDRWRIATAIKDVFTDGIIATERRFWSSRAAQAAQLRFQGNLARPQAERIYRDHGGLEGQRLVEAACRRLIAESDILMSKSEDIRGVLSDAFLRMFGTVYQIYLASPLRKGLDAPLAPMTSAAFRADHVSGALERFSSLREITDVCTRYETAWYGAPRCVDSFRGAMVEGREAFLYIMSHAGAFEIEVHDSSVPRGGGGRFGFSRFRILQLKPRTNAQQPPGFLAEAQIPRMLRAIDQAFWRLVERP